MAAAPALFICHAFTENAFVQDLGLALEAYRLPVWRDTRQLRGDERLVQDVRWAIEQAPHVIVVLGLNTGDPAWLRREIEVAQKTERRRDDAYHVIPLLLPGMDPSILDHWFTPPPPTPPIFLTAEGLGAALPTLLNALGAPHAADAAIERASPPMTELELTFSPVNTQPFKGWQMTACLNRHPEPEPPASINTMTSPLPSPVATRTLRWYWQDYPRWPTDAARQIARRTDAALADWGHRLYQAILDRPELQTLLAGWRDPGDPREHRLTLRMPAADLRAAALLHLPWELLRDGTGFLIQSKQPVEFQRRLTGGGDAVLPSPPPLRLLVISPRPDTEPTGHPDYRRSALPLLEAISHLGALVEPQILVPPTLAMLEKQLNEAWAAGRPFTTLHLDGYLLSPVADETGVTRFAFETRQNSPAAKYREAEFVAIPALASLLTIYRIRLVALTCPASMAMPLASALLAAGIAAVITVHSDVSVEALRRFWSAFYEELLRGARIGQAMFAGQRRLASDSYRTQGLGGGGIHLQDWFAAQLYLGHHDPRLALRPPLELWRRLQGQNKTSSLGLLPELPSTGLVGRGRNLLIMERLLEHYSAIFLRGVSGCGKTTTVIALAHWLVRCGRYQHVAYLRDAAASEFHTLVESLGRQLLPNNQHWTVGHYPGLWQAVDHLWQTLHAHPTLIVLDQIELWPSEHDELFERFWKKLLDEWPGLRLLAIGRLGPPSFAAPWKEIVLGPLDDEDAITLVGRTLIASGEIPHAADDRSGFQPLHQQIALVGGHPGALRRLAHEISTHGMQAALEHLRSIRLELLRQHGDDAQFSLYLELELALRRLPISDREQLALLAFIRNGVNRLVLEQALGLDKPATDALCERLITLNLAKDEGYGHLRINPALSNYLSGQLDAQQRVVWRERWRAAMEELLSVLYQQYFKDHLRTVRLLRLELPNFLALLRDCHQHPLPERTARLAGQMEQLFTHLGAPAALAEAAAVRERASQALPSWNRIRFESERLRLERLRDGGSLEDAVQAARQLVLHCQEAGANAYPGAPYDTARSSFELGKLLKLAGAAEPAVRELTIARQEFRTLAEAGNANAARMAAVADAEIGDCLTYLQRLQDAADAYETALSQADPKELNPTVAANQMHLGRVRQQQGHFADAVTLFDAARRTFEMLGQPENAAQAWRQLGIAYKLDGQAEQALHACQKSLYLYEQQRQHLGIAEVLGELGHLHQLLNQLEEAVLAYRRMAELFAQLNDGNGEKASRNKLANILIQLRRPDEARQELYRASECNLPTSLTARNWTIRRGLRDVSQSVQNAEVADQARQQAIKKYSAYRRAGGENNNPGIRLCMQISQALRADDTEAISLLAEKLEQITASPNVPPAGKLLTAQLKAILAGSRDPVLALDPDLHYQYAVELQLLLEALAANDG